MIVLIKPIDFNFSSSRHGSGLVLGYHCSKRINNKVMLSVTFLWWLILFFRIRTTTIRNGKKIADINEWNENPLTNDITVSCQKRYSLTLRLKLKTDEWQTFLEREARLELGWRWMAADVPAAATSWRCRYFNYCTQATWSNCNCYRTAIVVLWKESAYSRPQDFPIYLYIAWASQLNSRWSSLNSCRNSTESK